MNYSEIHPNFKLNNKSYTKETLCEMAIEIIRDGDTHEKDLGELILQWFDQNEYIILRTSGTTGESKEIKVDKQLMLISAKATGAFFDLTPDDKALLCLPTRYIAGKMMFVRAISLGLDLDFVNPTSTPLHNNDTAYSFVAMVPLQVKNSISKLHQIKKLIIGGAKLNKQIRKQVILSGIDAYETYGMTETVSHIAAKHVKEEYFKCFPDVQIDLDNRGCLIVKKSFVTDHPIITNDLVKIGLNNEFEWLGRIDNVINSGGIKILPEVIEHKLSDYIPYRFFVIGKEDDDLGNKLILVIESEPYQLLKEAFDRLEKYEKPKEILFVSKFIETPTGKIKRKESAKLS